MKSQRHVTLFATRRPRTLLASGQRSIASPVLKKYHLISLAECFARIAYGLIGECTAGLFCLVCRFHIDDGYMRQLHSAITLR